MWKNTKMGIVMVVTLILGAMMGKSIPISNNSDAKNNVTINQGYPESLQKFDEISKNQQKSTKINKNQQKSASISRKQNYTGEPIDINTATLYELKKLDGIWNKNAQAIIDTRPHSSIYDLMEKTGIGATTFNKIEELIKVGA